MSLLFSAIKFSMVVLTLIPSIVVGTVTMNSVAVVWSTRAGLLGIDLGIKKPPAITKAKERRSVL